MIAHLKGNVLSCSGQEVVVSVAGVGYAVTCTAECLSKVAPKKTAEIIVHTDVQERSIRLFGFSDQLEKQVFNLLTSVSGIGAQSAVDILSRVDKMQLLKLIASLDSAGLRKVKGVGPKTADRLIVELKDKVAELVAAGRMIVPSAQNTQMDEALQAMVALGFSQSKALNALEKVSKEFSKDGDPGEMVRSALAYM